MPPPRNLNHSWAVLLFASVTRRLNAGMPCDGSAGREPKMSRNRPSISHVVA
nr:MAG TPA: hypothetical protein [Caudoviricetes sp.]